MLTLRQGAASTGQPRLLIALCGCAFAEPRPIYTIMVTLSLRLRTGACYGRLALRTGDERPLADEGTETSAGNVRRHALPHGHIGEGDVVLGRVERRRAAEPVVGALIPVAQRTASWSVCMLVSEGGACAWTGAV